MCTVVNDNAYFSLEDCSIRKWSSIYISLLSEGIYIPGSVFGYLNTI